MGRFSVIVDSGYMIDRKNIGRCGETAVSCGWTVHILK